MVLKEILYELILMQFATQWSWKEMVLKEVAMYKIVDNFVDNFWIWLKFWHNMDTYKGHLWCELQLPASPYCGSYHKLCVFLTLCQICSHGWHNGHNRHSEIWTFEF